MLHLGALAALFLVLARASSSSDETCADGQKPSPRMSLLQARHARSAGTIHRATPQSRLTVNPSGAAAPLDDIGYHAVADRCCQAEMKEFIAREVLELGMEVCIESGLNGIVPYHSCGKGPQSFDALNANLLKDSTSKCPWLANTGLCKALDPSCPTFADVPPLPDCGCSISQAVILDFENAAMVQNNFGGKGPDSGAQEMRFKNIGEYPAGQPFEVVMSTSDRFESWNPSSNGVTKFPKFVNIALNGAGNPSGFSGEVKVQVSFVKPGSTTAVVLPEVFFAVFDVDGSPGLSRYQTLSGKGYAGYVTDVNTELEASKTADGRTQFTATQVNVLNPTDPMTASDKQRQSMVMYFYKDVSSFEINLGVLGAGSGRNFNFAGKCALMDRCGA